MGQSRCTGRTTKILEYMLSTEFDIVFFISKTQSMSKYHCRMFEDLVRDQHYSFYATENVIYVGGKKFFFIGETVNLAERTKGFPVVDIYRDHTVFDYSEET